MLTAPIIEGHLSSACCHLGLVSHQMGRPMKASELDNAPKNPHMADAWNRMKDHLRANEVDMSTTPITVGLELDIDVDRESAIRNPQANAMFTRTCREPFTFPNGLPA